MMKKLLLIGSAAVLINQASVASTLTLNGHTYAVTTGTYSGSSNWSTAVQAEFGSGSSVADFATLKLDSVGSADMLWDFLIAEGASTTYVKYNSQQFISSYPIFLQLHEEYPGPSWAVVDYIDPTPTGYPDRIDLGRWNLGNQKILAVTTAAAVPEPASVTLVGLGLLGLGFRRRRN